MVMSCVLIAHCVLRAAGLLAIERTPAQLHVDHSNARKLAEGKMMLPVNARIMLCKAIVSYSLDRRLSVPNACAVPCRAVSRLWLCAKEDHVCRQQSCLQ